MEVDVLRVHGNILEFRSAFYQIANMSAVEVVPISRPVPLWALSGLGLGSLLLVVGNWMSAQALLVMGLGCAAAAGHLVLRHYRKPGEHGLLLLLNAGRESSAIIVSPHHEFLREMARRISELMNERFMGEIVFNIQNQEIRMQDVSGSVVNTGSIAEGVANTLVALHDRR